jgi:hypothetical protein
LTDRSGFLAADCRGDLSDMALSSDLMRRRWWPGLVVVTATPGHRCLSIDADHCARAVQRERAEAAPQVEQADANDRREDHQAKKIDHRRVLPSPGSAPPDLGLSSRTTRTRPPAYEMLPTPRPYALTRPLEGLRGDTESGRRK